MAGGGPRVGMASDEVRCDGEQSLVSDDMLKQDPAVRLVASRLQTH